MTFGHKTTSTLALNSLSNIDQKWQVLFCCCFVLFFIFLANVECQDFSV